MKAQAEIFAFNSAFGDQIAPNFVQENDENVPYANERRNSANVSEKLPLFLDEEVVCEADGFFSHGYGSDAEVVENVTASVTAQEEIRGRMAVSLGDIRYLSFLDPINGGIFTRWRTTEKDSYRTRVIAVDKVFAMNGRKKLKWTCSATVHRWGPEQAIEKLVLWQRWHRLWIYCIPSDRVLPPSLLVPTKAVLPKNFNIETVGNDGARSSVDVPDSESESENDGDDENIEENSPDMQSSADETDVSFEDHVA